MKHLYIVLLSIIIVACANTEKNKKNTLSTPRYSNDIVVSQLQFTSENMLLGKLEEHFFNQTIKTSGLIDVPPQNKAIISTFMGGYITKTPLLIGDMVTKGQLLVTLENPEFVEIQQEYLEIFEQLNYLKSEFTRQKTLFDEKITSQKNYLKAESTYKSSLALFNGLRKKLEMLNINPLLVEQGDIVSTINLFSPIEGYITRVDVSNGAYVSPADVIMQIVDTKHIHLELSIFEKDILNVEKGQKINFKIPEASLETFEAEVHLVGTTIDKRSRIVKVHGHLNDQSKVNFIVGMFVEAEIITNAAKNLALPKDAIIKIENDYFVLALREKTGDTYYFEKIKIDVTNQNEKYILVQNTDNLIGKDILVKGGFMLINEGDGGHSH